MKLTGAVSDMLHDQSDLDIFVYDRANSEAFLGHVKVPTSTAEEHSTQRGWFKLEARDPAETGVSGEIYLELEYLKSTQKHYGVDDFQVLRLIGKGTFLFLLHARGQF